MPYHTISEEQDRQTTAARLALCARPYFSVFFHLLSSSRRWLRWIDSGFLSEGFSVQARFVADPLLQCSFFSFSSEDFEKFEVFPQSGGRRV